MSDGPVPAQRWVAELPQAGGGSLDIVAGGLLVAGPEWTSVLTAEGRPRWTAPAAARAGDWPVALDDATVARIEEGAVVIRDGAGGDVLSRWPAARSSLLTAAPWGDVLLLHIADDLRQAVRCVTRAGSERWSVPLGAGQPRPALPFFPVADVVVVVRDGLLWAYDRDGRPRWAADRAGVWSADERPAAPDAVAVDGVTRIDAGRVLAEVTGAEGAALVEIDGRGPALRMVAEPAVLRPQLAVAPGADGYRVAGYLGQVDAGHMEYVYPVRMLGSDGTTIWDHRLPARGRSLASTPDGGVVAGASPTARVWREYGAWQDLSRQTFARLIGPAGAEVWTWYAPGLISHAPLAGPGGAVYVGSEGRLFALDAEWGPS
jgi:hypothetical protein